MDSNLTLSLLGKPTVSLGNSPLRKLTYKKSLALLCYLAVTKQVYIRDALVGLLWGQSPEGSAQAGLRKSLAELKAEIGEYLLIDNKQVAFNQQIPYFLDIEVLETTLRQFDNRSESDLDPNEIDQLTKAIALYQGDFLDGFYVHNAPEFETWVLHQREHFRVVGIDGLFLLSKTTYRQGDFPASTEHTRRLLELEPCHEQAHRQLMSLYMLAGQRELALRQYERCQDILAETFKMPPTEKTTELYNQIRKNPPSSSVEESFKLPVPETPLIGRQSEMAALKEQLLSPDCRFLTILGAGGIGKTHLALSLAADLLQKATSTFEDGIVFVPLSTLNTIQSLPSAIAHQLNYQFNKESPPMQQLLMHIANKQMLLVLDNFEHLLAPDTTIAAPGDNVNAADLDRDPNPLTQILQQAPGVKLLLTSRIRLNLKGEYIFPLSGIKYPASEAKPSADSDFTPAVTLYLNSAKRINPNFDSSAENIAEINKICQLIEGSPLGILLAAGWSSLLTPPEIAARLTTDSGIDLLENDMGDFPQRHHSLRAVLAYSWQLLSNNLRGIFSSLSIFPASFTLEAAELVAQARLADLRSLIDHSLLQRTAGGRFTIHEFTRQFALEQSSDIAAVRTRFKEFYCDRLVQLAEDIKGREQLSAIEYLDQEHGNARAALDWAVADGDLGLVGLMMDGLFQYYDWRYRYPEGLSACKEILALIEALIDDQNNRIGTDIWRLKARVLVWQAIFSPMDKAEPLLQQSKSMLERYDEKECLAELAFTDYHLAWVLSQTGRPDIGRQLYEKSGELFERLGDQWNLANALHSLGVLLWDQSKYLRSQEYIDRSLKIKEEIGDKRGIAALLSWSGMNAIFQGDYRGESLIRQSVAIYTELGERIRVLEGIQLASIALMVLGRFEETRSLMEEIVIADDKVYLRGDSNQSILASTLIHLGRYDEARTHSQQGLALAKKMGDPYTIGFAHVVSGWLAIHNGDFVSAERVLGEGASICEEHGIMDVYCWALASAGYAAYKLGKANEARYAFTRVNKTSLELDSLVGKVFSLALCLPVILETGQDELALEIYSLLRNYPMFEKSKFFNDLVREQIAKMNEPPSANAAISENEVEKSVDLDTVLLKVQKVFSLNR